MRFLLFYLLGTLLDHCKGNLPQTCRDNKNRPVDWWFIYKPPADVLPPYSGANFTFITPDTKGRWEVSPVDITNLNMLTNTWRPRYRRSSTNTIGRAIAIFHSWLDKSTKSGTSARGIIVADEQGGFLLTHSVPGFPARKNQFAFPLGELANGHLFSCVSLDHDALNEAVTAIKESAANITFSDVPEKLSHLLPEWEFHGPYATIGHNPSIYYLIHGNGTGVIRKPHEAIAMIVARAPNVKSCIYMTFAARQQIMLNVYGQSRNAYLATSCLGDKFGVRNLDSICLKLRGPEGVEVFYITNSTDYSRFGVSTAAHWQHVGAGPRQFWVCTSLVDREAPGEGGLLLCLQNYELWVAFDNMKLAEPKCYYSRKPYSH